MPDVHKIIGELEIEIEELKTRLMTDEQFKAITQSIAILCARFDILERTINSHETDKCILIQWGEIERLNKKVFNIEHSGKKETWKDRLTPEQAERRLDVLLGITTPNAR